MTPQELAAHFLQNPEQMERYSQSISMLRRIGFESIVRRLGEPSDSIPLDSERHIELSAIDQIEKRGFQRAIDLIFDFPEMVIVSDSPESSSGDYGAAEAVESMGYNPKEFE